MGSLLLSLVLGAASLVLVALTPSQVDAQFFWRGRVRPYYGYSYYPPYGYSNSYYWGPGYSTYYYGNSYPGYTRYYYSPGYYGPGYSTNYTPDTSHYHCTP